MTHKSPAVPVDNTQTASTDLTASSTDNMATTSQPTPNIVIVTYTDAGFSPKTVNLGLGDSVKFVNNSSKKMWIASDPHPVHTGYDGTTVQEHCATGAIPSFDECTAVSKGGTYTFTFGKVGSWGYHNHSSHDDTGTIVVLQQTGS